MTTPTDPPPGPAVRPRRGRVFRAAALLAGLGFVVGVVAYLWHSRGGPEPPAVRPDGLEPAVWTAIEKARVAVRGSPRSGSTWGRLGMVLLAHHLHAEAEPCFVRAEQLDPRDPRWPYHLGVILSLRNPEAAIPKWQRAVELGKADAAPHCRLADALLNQGRPDEAGALFEHVLQREPAHPLAHL